MIGAHDLLAQLQAAVDQSGGGEILVYVGPDGPMVEYDRINVTAMNDEGSVFVILRVVTPTP